MTQLLEGLNPNQRAAVENINGPSLIIAGAGSGKTRVLTLRIAYLLKSGVAPYNVLALTFTNKAAKEMKERIGTVVDKKLANKLWMGTFHSIFARILRVEAEHLGFTPTFTIYDTTDTLSLIRTIVKEMKLDEKDYKDRAVYSRISLAKNHLMTPKAYSTNVQLTSEDIESRKPKISEIYARYTSRCKMANAMDFDDLLLYTNILFRDNPEVLNKYQNIFKYILVDEYQDTNTAQYLIVKKLSELNRNISVVGDDAQSIYSFRGARIENILNFRNDYKDYKEFKLEQNYRSTQTIVNAANSLIAKNRKQLKKKCFSEGDLGERIEVIKTYTDQEEGIAVSSSILDLKYNNVSFSQIAILYRTNAQSRIFEDALRKKNIPYKIYGGISFYQRAEIKDAISYIRLAANPSDDEAFKRVINYPARGIGATTMERLQQASNENNLSLWQTIIEVPLENYDIRAGTLTKLKDFCEMVEPFTKKVHTQDAYTFATEMMKRVGIISDLKSNKNPEGISKLENLEELLNSVREFTEIKEAEENTLEAIPITEFIQNVALLTDADEQKGDDKITLMTVHSAKGLEFEYIYIVGVEEGLFPSTRSSFSENDLEEERRLFYVALTRAAIKATITYSQTRFKYGNMTSSSPSRFINEIDPSYILSDTISTSGNSSIPKRQLKPLTPKSGGIQPTLNQGTASVEYSEIKTGLEVVHERFGTGKVLAVDDDKAQIQFYNAGVKTLLLKFAKLKLA